MIGFSCFTSSRSAFHDLFRDLELDTIILAGLSGFS